DAAEGGVEGEGDAEGGERGGGIAQAREKGVHQRVRELVQLGGQDQREEEPDRGAQGERSRGGPCSVGDGGHERVCSASVGARSGLPAYDLCPDRMPNASLGGDAAWIRCRI